MVTVAKSFDAPIKRNHTESCDDHVTLSFVLYSDGPLGSS